MIISVLIPTRDYNCYSLAYQLQKQLSEWKVLSDQAGQQFDYEVIIVEDGSRDQVSLIGNHLIIEQHNCRHIRIRENLGRAAIRNYLVKESKGDWLLFADSDAKVVHNDFIKRYMEAIADNTDVVVGGLCNPDNLPSDEATLRYYYEKSAEYQRPADYRKAHPYEHFSTFNFLISRKTINDIPFNEKCTQYGYEDALMGIDLMRQGKTIKHIDNPLMHLGFEKNAIFLSKTETALQTLSSLGNLMIPHSRIGKVAEKVSRYKLKWFVKTIFLLTKPILRSNLTGKKPNMKVFAFYKLGYFLFINNPYG